MLFNSPEFFLFFLVTVLIWFVVTNGTRWVVLLSASYFFYMSWNPGYVLILISCTLVTYFTALWMEQLPQKKHRKLCLLASITANLVFLCFFKYFNFLNESICRVFAFANVTYQLPHLEIIVPIGISFYALQALSYSMDVYWGKQKAEGHLGIFALYLAFFPKLISGPIERGTHLLPQLRKKYNLDWDRISSGANLFLWGILKKVVIADRLAIYVDMVFSRPQDFSGQTLILASWFFTLQIYCDFSAYTDIAIGCGRILGIELVQNFKFPYFARSVQDFWRRWHISLTTWFRDYLYIPLGGNRVGRDRWRYNILVVFLLSGLWHGASWTFVFWGALHGFYYLFGKATAPARSRFRKTLGLGGAIAAVWQVLLTFNLVAIAWVFFRAKNFQDAFYVITHMFVDLSAPLRLGPSAFTTGVTAVLVSLFVLLELLRYLNLLRLIRIPISIPFALKCPAYSMALVTIFLFGVNGNEFIYFHF